MSVTLRAFALDLDEYRAAQGSGNLALAEGICKQAAAQIAAEDAWFVRLRPDHLPLATAIKDLIAGTVRGGRAAALSYQVAALLIAEYLGDRIDDDAIAEYPSHVQEAIDGAISELLAEHGGTPGDWPLLADVLTRGPALDIPWEREALPNGTGLVAQDEVQRAARAVEGIAPQGDGGARELAMMYGRWLVDTAKDAHALLLACD
jgi:hypothetical protein